MKTIFVLLIALSCTSSALAQNRNTLITENNNLIKSNGVGAITGPVLNSMLFNVIEGSANQSDNNAFTGNNTHSGTETFTGPVVGVLPHVPNNAALQAVVPSAGQVYVRDGFYAAGDGGGATYVGSTTNCTTPDNGAQVQPSGTGCWIVAASISLDIRVWPVKGSSTANGACTLPCDDGPGLRAAAAYSALTGTRITFPINVVYEVNTLDSSTLGGIVVGPQPLTTTSAATASAGSSITLNSVAGVAVGDNVAVITTTGDRFPFVVASISGDVVGFGSYSNFSPIASGAAFWDYNPTVPSGAPIFEGERPVTNGGYCGYLTYGVGTIQLGPNLNRPLVYEHPQTAAFSLKNECLDGNRNNQTGWYVGGPGYGSGNLSGGRLYTVQLADGTTTFEEGSMQTDHAGLSGGFNGAAYLGSSRGVFDSYSTWYVYNGQSTYDNTILMNGYDTFLLNPNIGNNTGIGIAYSEGIQHQLIGGAIFSNYTGIVLNGGAVGGFNANGGTNISGNICGSVIETAQAPNGGNYAGGHVFDGIVFDSNSTQGSGACNEIEASSSYLSLISPSFTTRTASKPNYSIHFNNGTAIVKVTSPTFGAPTGNPYVTAFSSAPSQIVPAASQGENAWTPVLQGATTAGSPTYAIQKGSWSRNNGEITAKFSIQWSALGSPSGNMQISGLPLTSTATTNVFGSCTLNLVSGWTADTGYSTISAIVGVGQTIVSLYENGSGHSGQPIAAGTLGSSGQLYGSCVYNTDQ
jgi:hypothetical protein